MSTKKPAAKPKAKKVAPKAPASKAAPKAVTPKHPLKLNGQSWDKAKVMTILCQAIATSSASIATILAAGHEGNDLPSYSTVALWLASDTDLSEQYARAKEAQAEHMAEEMLDIADNAQNDWMERLDKDEQGIGWQLNGDHVQRSRLRIEARKWLMGKLKPKKYGEKLDVDLTDRRTVSIIHLGGRGPADSAKKAG